MTDDTMPRCAMVLAAGRGERLRPLTDQVPKPLVEVDGRRLLDRVLDSLAAVGVTRAVVNTHHLADQITGHLKTRETPRITISHEETLLDTGGGIANALGLIGDEPFLATNADAIVLDGARPAWRRLAGAWDPDQMDALLLLHPTVSAYGYDGRGDFAADSLGLLRRRREWETAPYLFAGAQVLHPRLFAEAPAGAFSLNRLFDAAIERERLYGIVHDGAFLHIGTPAALEGAARHMRLNL